MNRHGDTIDGLEAGEAREDGRGGGAARNEGGAGEDPAQPTRPLSRELRTLFHLDADVAEALWALDQPITRFDVMAMTRDTVASLATIPEALTAFLDLLNPSAQAQLAAAVKAVRASLAPSDAYLQIPGRDPAAAS